MNHRGERPGQGPLWEKGAPRRSRWTVPKSWLYALWAARGACLPGSLRPARSPPSNCHVLETTPGSQPPFGVNASLASAPAGARVQTLGASRELSRQLRTQRLCPASAGSAPSADLLPESPGPGDSCPCLPQSPPAPPWLRTGRPSRCSGELGPGTRTSPRRPAPSAVGVTDTACGGRMDTSGSNSVRATRIVGCLAVSSRSRPSPSVSGLLPCGLCPGGT